MYRFLLLTTLVFLTISCSNTDKKAKPSLNVPKEAIKEATNKIDDLVPRIVEVDVHSLVDEDKQLAAINFLINGIGYPTKLEEDGRVLVNIAGVQAGSQQFKARMAYTDKTEVQKLFVVNVTDEATVLKPVE